jgi:hypothetical protein
MKCCKHGPKNLHLESVLVWLVLALLANISQGWKWLTMTSTMIEQVALKKKSLIPKKSLQNTQTLQPFAIYAKTKYLHKILSMSSWLAGVERPSGLLKVGWSTSTQAEDCLAKST